MSGFQVKGLLDRPSRESLGMLGLIVNRENRGLFSEGIVGMDVSSVLKAGQKRALSRATARGVDRGISTLRKLNCDERRVGSE